MSEVNVALKCIMALKFRVHILQEVIHTINILFFNFEVLPTFFRYLCGSG